MRADPNGNFAIGALLILLAIGLVFGGDILNQSKDDDALTLGDLMNYFIH